LNELQVLFASGVKTGAVLEPLQCCPLNANSIDIKAILDRRGFDVAGVQSAQNGEVLGYVEANALGGGRVSDHLKHLNSDMIISDSTPLGEVFRYLRSKQWAFVTVGVGIRGIITRADLNKPPVRVYLFALISLLEMHLRYWIRRGYPNDAWKSHLDERRLRRAQDLEKERCESNDQISLLACLQFADLRDLVISREDLRANLNLASKTQAGRLLRRAEVLRNSLAHSQSDLIEGSNWEDMIALLSMVELSVAHSDRSIEEAARTLEQESPNLWSVDLM